MGELFLRFVLATPALRNSVPGTGHVNPLIGSALQWRKIIGRLIIVLVFNFTSLPSLSLSAQYSNTLYWYLRTISIKSSHAYHTSSGIDRETHQPMLMQSNNAEPRPLRDPTLILESDDVESQSLAPAYPASSTIRAYLLAARTPRRSGYNGKRR